MTTRGCWGALVPSVVLLFASGCSDVDTTCTRGDRFASHADIAAVSAPELMGELILSAEQTDFGTSFDAVLDKLPEVWADEGYGPTLGVHLTLEYLDIEPVGAELPEVTVMLEPRRGHTSPFAAAQATATMGGQSRAGAGLGVTPFVMCSPSSSEDCCPYAASRCFGGATLLISRAADLFPPVRIGYRATLSGKLYSCEPDPSAATLTFEEVDE